MRYELLSKRTLVVQGPASLTLLNGQARILGEPLMSGQRKVVPRVRQLPIESERGAEIEIILAKPGKTFEIQGSTIPPSWELAVASLREMQEGNVVILGPTDVGKSTLCVYLLNRLRRDVEILHIVDADIGQTDLGPPTSIAVATPTQPITSLTELRADATLFIGHTSPTYVQSKLISGIKRLATMDENSLTIINTDGWIAELAAIRYKINLINEIEPNLILGLAMGDELQPILRGVRNCTMQLDAAKNVLARSRADRRVTRTAAYRRFLEGGVTSTMRLRDVTFITSNHIPAVTVTNRLTLLNLIIGILDDAGYLTHIGILIDIQHDTARIYSTQRDAIRNIALGFVKLSRSGEEIGFL